MSHMDQKQLQRFGEFLASPYFVKDDKLYLFFQAIRKYAPEFDSAKLEKSAFIKKGVEGLHLDEKKLSYLMSDLTEAGERFLKAELLMQKDLEGYCALLSTYNDWESDKLYEQTLRKARKHLEESQYRNPDFFYQQYLLQSELNAYFDRQKKRALDMSLQQAANYLDLYYLSVKLRYSCELINRQKLVAADYDLRMLREVRSHIEEHDYTEFPSIMIYYRVLMTFLENDDTGHFDSLKALLAEHANAFPPEEARDLYAYAQNYCIRKANAGKESFLRELLQLYQASIEEGLVLTDGHISPWSYKNIVSVATRVQETDWAEQFAKQYKKHLHEKFRNNAFNYNMAYLLFARKQFGKALTALLQVEFTDVFYALDSRTLQIKIYFELEETDALMSALEAFKVYLRRNRTISDSVRTIYMNFVRFVNRILSVPPSDSEKKQKLHEKILEAGNVADIRWLLQKTA